MADERTAALTYEQRDRLRRLIDQAKRQQLARQNEREPKRDPAKRRASYAAYYQRNRTRILARRAEQRAA